VNFYRMNKDAVAPRRATSGSACYDLHACINEENFKKINHPLSNQECRGFIFLSPGQRLAIPTGIILDIPEGHVVKVFARSGLSYKNGISLANCVGIIDHDYREELFVLLQNNSSKLYKINHGDRIAQMLLEKVLNYELLETHERPAILSSRSGGMGSTGNE